MARTGPSDGRPEAVAAGHSRAGYPVIGPGALFGDAIRPMEEADVELLPDLDGDAFVGVVTTAEILSRQEILDRTLGET